VIYCDNAINYRNRKFGEKMIITEKAKTALNKILAENSGKSLRVLISGFG